MIPNGVDVPEEVPARPWMPEGILRVMYIGRLDPVKGIENLLQALGRLHQCAATVDIYGSGDHAYATVLAELGRSLGVDGQVRFHGFVEGEARRSAFLSADVCVVPSYSENFGMVVAEALAHGVPVIASRATPWAGVETQGCGCWVDNSPDELAKAIRWMREQDLEAMGRRGSRWMREAFSWETVARQMCEVYRTLTASPASALLQ
jgi:glycosyltransferase involved in cell wall biosynthesis